MVYFWASAVSQIWCSEQCGNKRKTGELIESRTDLTVAIFVNVGLLLKNCSIFANDATQR